MMKIFRHIAQDFTKNRKRAVGITLLVHLLFVLILALWSWTIPMPPPPELGILINFGDNTTGQGSVEPSPTELAQQTPQQMLEQDQKKILTQDFEEALSLKKQQEKVKKTPVKPTVATAKPTPTVQEPVQQVNQRALFSGKGEQASSGEGLGTTPGNQGSKDGVANAPHGAGGGGSGNFSLAGRTIVGSLPKPLYTENTSGTVMVEIIVDKAGNVIKATALVQGSTVQDDALFKAAEKAALRAKFNVSESAAGIQRGTITYQFRIQN